MATVQVAGVSGQSGAPATVQIAAVSGSSVVTGSTVQVAFAGGVSIVGGSTVQVAAVSGVATVSTTLQARPGVAQQPSGLDTVSLDGTQSTGAIAVSSWSQVSGPAATINPPTGVVASYTAPAQPTVSTLVFRLTVSDGSQIASATVTHTVFPWITYYVNDSGVFVPEVESVLT